MKDPIKGADTVIKCYLSTSGLYKIYMRSLHMVTSDTQLKSKADAIKALSCVKLWGREYPLSLDFLIKVKSSGRP